jgi:hypothetical protein
VGDAERIAQRAQRLAAGDEEGAGAGNCVEECDEARGDDAACDVAWRGVGQCDGDRGRAWRDRCCVRMQIRYGCELRRRNRMVAADQCQDRSRQIGARDGMTTGQRAG